jgi:hypothetical protein
MHQRLGTGLCTAQGKVKCTQNVKNGIKLKVKVRERDLNNYFSFLTLSGNAI